jgi:hypothetical protein
VGIVVGKIYTREVDKDLDHEVATCGNRWYQRFVSRVVEQQPKWRLLLWTPNLLEYGLTWRAAHLPRAKRLE